jgi:hypothetical protein
MKLITLPIVLLIIFVSNSCSAQINDCYTFKVGKFEIVDSIKNKTYNFERNDSLQIEKDSDNKEPSIFKINWINDCEYSLQLISGDKNVMDFFKMKILHIKILETQPDRYKFSASIEGSSQIVYNTVKKVEK